MLAKALLYTVVFGSSIAPLYAAQMLIGNGKNDQTFTFNVLAHGFYIPQGRFFVGAHEAVKGNEFAVAIALRNGTQFRPLTPEKVRFNGQADSNNPLFGAAISHMSLLAGRPVVLKSGDPSSLYLVDSNTVPTSVYAAQNIHDAQDKKASALLGVTTSASQVVTELEAGASLAAFVAVGNKNGGFDGDGSGIALLFFKKFTNKDSNTSFSVWDIVNAQTGASQFDNAGQPIEGGNKAIPIGKDTASVFINHPVSVIDKAVDLFFDRDLGRLYIALQVQAGDGVFDGARAVVVASLTNGKLLLQPIAPDVAFDKNAKIVGGQGALSQTLIFKVRTMQTTTYLRYLIVVGGNAVDPLLAQRVFALPLVDNIQDPAHGTLANVASEPLTIFNENPPFRFLTRVFTEPAKKPEDLYNMYSEAAQVGGGSTLPGRITDITTSSDAIFVSVDEEDNTTMKAGMFYSQALFDELGKIRGWTAWQRVAGTQEKVKGFSYDPYKGEFWYIPGRGIDGKKTLQTSVVLRTEFSQSNDPFSFFISQAFSQLSGGVQGLFDFPFTTPSFTTQVGKRIAVNVFTGFEKIMLMQTGADMGDLFGPQRDISAPFETTNGTLALFSKASTVIVSGGVLADIGPIGTAAVVTDGTFGWFAIGGSEGVALLADNNGRGWDAHVGLSTQFQGLNGEMAFKKISNAKNVRKLIAIGNILFVLTNNSVERLTIKADVIASNSVSSVTIARLTEEQVQLSSSYSDLVVSGPLALLGTSFGLLRSGNLVDIRRVHDQSVAGWKQVTLPESAGSFTGPGPVSRLFAISPDGFETSVAQGGNIIVLNAYIGLSQAQLYRLVLNVVDNLVTDETVQPFPDLFIKDAPTFFANLGDYRNYVITDGALIAVSRSAFAACKPLLELLPPTLKSGQPQGARGRVPFVNVQENSPGLQTFSMGKLLRDSASGSWIVPGDFGVRIQQ